MCECQVNEKHTFLTVFDEMKDAFESTHTHELLIFINIEYT